MSGFWWLLCYLIIWHKCFTELARSLSACMSYKPRRVFEDIQNCFANTQLTVFETAVQFFPIQFWRAFGVIQVILHPAIDVYGLNVMYSLTKLMFVPIFLNLIEDCFKYIELKKCTIIQFNSIISLILFDKVL